MDVIQAQLLRKSLEQEITSLCRQFETTTGLKVTNFNIYNVSVIRQKPKTEHITVDVELI